MTETDTGTEKATPEEDAPAIEATETPEPEKPSTRRELQARAEAVRSALTRSRRRLVDRGVSGWEMAVAALAAVGIVAALVVGTDGLWPWLVAALLLVAAFVAFVVYTITRAAPSPAKPPTTPTGAREAPRPAVQRERAEVAPFSVRTSLYSRHLLRLLDRSRPRGQVVIPVSGGHRVQILIEAHSDDPVDLQDIRPVVTSREPIRHGEPVVTAEGALPQQHFDLALDEDPPRLLPVEDREGVTPSLPMSIRPNELELIVLAPRGTDEEVAWHLELDWTCGHRNGTLAVDLGDHPFRVTAETGWTTFYPDGGPPIRAGWD